MLAVLQFLWPPAVLVLLVLGWLWLDRALGWHGPRVPWAGSLLVLAGALLVAWCGSLFAEVGKGTPHPFIAKTQCLVVVGPYRYVRNSMIYGVGALLVGLALWLGSVGLWFGLAMFVVFVALFVPLYEEPDMERRFGEEYREYCRLVPRWWPHFRGAAGAGDEMQAFVRFAWFPTVVVAVVLGWLRLDALLGCQGPRVTWLGMLLVFAGGLLNTWLVFLFARLGEGTPHPFAAKTKRLVIAGPYRYVRNPMMYGVGTILMGLALWLGSVGLWFGLAMFVVFVALFVPLYEERDMQRRFGEEYREYCRRVPRWWPRLSSKRKE